MEIAIIVPPFYRISHSDSSGFWGVLGGAVLQGLYMYVGEKESEASHMSVPLIFIQCETYSERICILEVFFFNSFDTGLVYGIQCQVHYSRRA